MTTSATVKMRNFPPQLSAEEQEEFLRFFGAKYVKILTSKTTKKSTAFARFDSQDFAEAIIERLHQKEMFGYRLTAELCHNDLDVNLMDRPLPDPEPDSNTDKVIKLQQAYLKKINCWTTALDLNHPPPYHLRYRYPDPNKQILTNIANTLACNPKFYYQVLHLMNRMNLPVPFEPVKDSFQYKLIISKTADKCTTTAETDPELSESEMESEIDSDHIDKVEPKLSSLKRKLYKDMKPYSLKTNTGPVLKKKKIELSKMFDTTKCETKKKIEVKVSTELKPVEGPPVNTVGGFGIIYSTKCSTKKEENEKESESDDDITGDCISEEQLTTNRLSENDLKQMPFFKNYHPGAPSCRLYIKNLAKTVMESDLKYIYKRFITSSELKPGTMFDIRLMKEGRMKGQAFITLPCMENAQQALKETHGFILKNKPMFVQFARTSTVN